MYLAAADDPPTVDVSLPLWGWVTMTIVFFALGAILSLLSYRAAISKKIRRPYYSWVLSALSLLSYAGAVATVNANLLGGVLVDSATAASSSIAETATYNGLNSTVTGVAMAVAVVFGLLAIFTVRSPLTMVCGLIFGIAAIVAVQNPDYEWLNHVLVWWYTLVANAVTWVADRF